MPSNFKKPKVRDKAWRKFVKRDMRCIIGSTPFPDPAHIGGANKGTGTKVGDDCILPLSHAWHARQHQIGEITFWREAFDVMDPWMMMFFVRCTARELYRRYKEGVPASDIFKE